MSIGQDLYVQKTNILTKDNWFTEYFGKKNYSTYDIVRGNVQVGSIQSPYTYFTIFISRHDAEINIERTASNIIGCLGQFGGF